MKRLMFLTVALVVQMAAFATGRFSPLGISWLASSNSYQDAQFPGCEDYVYGWRASVFSGAHSRMFGLATALIANDDAIARGSVGGLQFATFYNSAWDAELGAWQIACLSNSLKSGGNGFQACLIRNDVSGCFGGVQFSAYNSASSDLYGVQFGLINTCERVFGVQFGLLNYAGTLTGCQLGIFNFVESSKLAMFPLARIGW